MAQFDQTTASRAVLIEVANVLGAFRSHLVVVGGWVPEFVFPNQGGIGSIDVDLSWWTACPPRPAMVRTLMGLARRVGIEKRPMRTGPRHRFTYQLANAAHRSIATWPFQRSHDRYIRQLSPSAVVGLTRDRGRVWRGLTSIGQMAMLYPPDQCTPRGNQL